MSTFEKTFNHFIISGYLGIQILWFIFIGLNMIMNYLKNIAKKDGVYYYLANIYRMRFNNNSLAVTEIVLFLLLLTILLSAIIITEKKYRDIKL